MVDDGKNRVEKCVCRGDSFSRIETQRVDTEFCLVKFEPVLGNSVLFALYPLAGFGRSTKAGKRISVASGANNRRETGG